MRITRLYLKNFIAIDVTQQKREIEIIFPKDKIINILYGPMGSGKTFILGHCQPWHTFGTLDIRNSDQQILSNEDGQKIFECEKENDTYVIIHDYIWNGKSHNTKHYFKKNGKEYNANGNLTTFNELIKLEFGIDQDFLRLIRIGDNVSNFIKLKGTERKKYIASRLAETETYLILFKKLSQDLRLINSKVDMIRRNLSNLNFDKVDEMKEEMSFLESHIKEISDRVNTIQKSSYQIEGKVQTMLHDQTLNQFDKELDNQCLLYDKLSADLDSMNRELDELKEELKPEELQREIGKLDGLLRASESSIEEKSMQFNSVKSTLDKIQETITIQKNEEQMKLIEGRYQSLLDRIKNIEFEVRFYPYEDSFQSLMNLESDVEQINTLLYTLSSYQEEDLIRVYHSDESIVRWAEKKVQILEAKKRKVKSEANNYQFSMEYSAPSSLFIPPFCPTEDCPYRKTHPITLRGNSKRKEIEALVQRKLSEAEGIDIEIYRYLEYSTIYSQLRQLRVFWKRSSPHLSRLKVLREDHLDLILTKRKNWIDGDKLTKWIGMAQKKDELFNLRDQMVMVKDELNKMKLQGLNELEIERDNLLHEKTKLLNEIEKEQYHIHDLEKSIKSLNDRYVKVSHLSRLRMEYEKKNIEVNEVRKKINEMKDIHSSVKDFEIELIEKRKQILLLQEEYGKSTQSYNQLRDIVNQIQLLQGQYEDVLYQQKLYSYIVEAVSPKEGIPLQIVAMYMNECKDVINELIADVFDDNLEIVEFHAEEDDFTIPYIVGGRIIEDVSRCSQGEKSIIGIAISFSMMNEENVSYDIPLLDEVDAPLHGSDRNRFMMLLAKWIKEKGIEQTIMITHNEIFDGYPIHLILTSDENFDSNAVQSIDRI